MLEKYVSIAPAISATAIVLSSIVALSVFLYTRHANRRRATLDMVMKTFLDDIGQKKYSEFKSLLRRYHEPDNCLKIENLIDPSNENREDRDLVLFQLNSYELISLGIRRGIFDESFYKMWFHSQFMKDFDHLQHFIVAAQARKSSNYCEFSSLQAKWKRNGHPVSSPSRLKMAWWAITKKYDLIDQARRSMNS